MKDGQGADMAAVKLVSLRPAGDDLGKALEVGFSRCELMISGCLSHCNAEDANNNNNNNDNANCNGILFVPFWGPRLPVSVFLSLWNCGILRHLEALSMII